MRHVRRPEDLIGKLCGYRIDLCTKKIEMHLPFVDGSFPDGYIEAIIEYARNDKINRRVYFKLVEKDNINNRQEFFIDY